MLVGEGKWRRITVVLGCGRGREGGFGDERLWGIWVEWLIGDRSALASALVCGTTVSDC